MSSRFALFIIIALLSAGMLTALAQDDQGNPNDPAINDRANACFEGGSLEGRCYQDFNADGIIDDGEIWWAWNCGWYLIRYEHGMLELPDWCEDILHVPAPPPTPTPTMVPTIVFEV